MSGCRASCVSSARVLVGKSIDLLALTDPVFGNEFHPVTTRPMPAVLSRTTSRGCRSWNSCEEIAVASLGSCREGLQCHFS